MTVSVPGLGSTGRSRNWGNRKTPSFRRTWASFTATLWFRRSAAAIYSSSPLATSMERSFTAWAIRHRFSTKFSRDRSGTAALTRNTPTIRATTGPAAQTVPRRWAIQTESAMAHPGIHRTPQKDAARQLWKAAAAQAFSTASQLTDIHRLAYAPGSAFLGRPLRAIKHDRWGALPREPESLHRRRGVQPEENRSPSSLFRYPLFARDVGVNCLGTLIWPLPHPIAGRIIFANQNLASAARATPHPTSLVGRPNDLCVMPTYAPASVRSIVVVLRFFGPRVDHLIGRCGSARDLEQVLAVGRIRAVNELLARQACRPSLASLPRADRTTREEPVSHVPAPCYGPQASCGRTEAARLAALRQYDAIVRRRFRPTR